MREVCWFAVQDRHGQAGHSKVELMAYSPKDPEMHCCSRDRATPPCCQLNNISREAVEGHTGEQAHPQLQLGVCTYLVPCRRLSLTTAFSMSVGCCSVSLCF